MRDSKESSSKENNEEILRQDKEDAEEKVELKAGEPDVSNGVPSLAINATRDLPVPPHAGLAYPRPIHPALMLEAMNFHQRFLPDARPNYAAFLSGPPHQNPLFPR